MWGLRRPGSNSRFGVWIAVLVVSASGLTGCAHGASPAPPSAADAALSVDPSAVLLDALAVDAALGTVGAKVVDQANAPDDTVDTNPPECHGLDYTAGTIEYAPTGFTAMAWQIVRVENSGNVVQMVAQLPSVATADEFIATQTKNWKACEGKVFTNTDKASKQVTSDRVAEVRSGPHTVIAAQDGPPGQTCQHILQAVSNIILDVDACSDAVSNPAEAIAAKLADRVQHSA
jgi:serine/threonine-protein kinase